MKEKDCVLKAIEEEKCSALFDSLYGAGNDGAERVRALICGWEKTFGSMDGRDCAIFSAPGRTELGGNHTDHQGGWALGGCIHLDTLSCVVKNGENVLRVQSKGHKMCVVDLDDLTPKLSERSSSVALVRGIASQIRERGFELCGMDIYTETRVPRASGVSSSAAFEILLSAIFNDICCGGVLSGEELAAIGQYAENVFYGKPCGLLDLLSCALGAVIAVNFKDPASPEIREMTVDFEADGYSLCIVDLGKGHGSLDAEYAAIPEEMARVAAYFGGEKLSDIEESALYADLAGARRACGDRAVLRAIHYFDENRRALDKMAALRAHDMPRFLRYVNESGRSSSTYLQNVSLYHDPRAQEASLALALAEKLLGGEGACRIHGGGFAGTIQVYVPKERCGEFCRQMDRLTGAGSCHRLKMRNVGPVRII